MLIEVVKKRRESYKNWRLSPNHKDLEYLVSSPNGEKIIVTNIRQFCKLHDLERSQFTDVIKKRRFDYRGWRLS